MLYFYKLEKEKVIFLHIGLVTVSEGEGKNGFFRGRRVTAPGLERLLVVWVWFDGDGWAVLDLKGTVARWEGLWMMSFAF